jgi:two-component system sensor histidine kinase VanS
LATKLKNNKKQKSSYSALQWKIYFRIALIAFSALVIVALLQILLNQRTANWIVSFLQNTFSLDFQSASRIYLLAIRNNITYLVYATFGIFFLIISRLLLTQFAKYFNEISNALDVLVGSKNDEIKLSPEMKSMEQKLTTIKQTLEKREQEAIMSEQRKNDVVMYLAHDIKTPLTSVIGYLSLLSEAPDMPQEQKAKYVNITLDKANQLERLVDEFFEIARYNFQTDILSKNDIDLYFMLSQMVDEFYPLLSSKGKDATLNVPEGFMIHADPDKLARVLNSILKNAIAYSVDNSVIEITATIIDENVLIIFKNEGTVPREKLAEIFDKFYRLDSARSSDTGGAGLGLAIAKEIVISHGGRIYDDRNEGNTTFTVELPATKKVS